jgi:hypothetical protein
MTRIARGCRRAVDKGEERLTVDPMDTVRNDAAAERGHLELQAALAAGTLTTEPRRMKKPQPCRAPRLL